MKVVFYGWVIEYGNGQHAFFSAEEPQNDEARVTLACTRLHGTIRRIYVETAALEAAT